MKIIHILPIALLLGACQSNQSENPITTESKNSPIEVALIYPEDSFAIVLESYLDTILMSDQFYEDQDQVFFNPTPKDKQSLAIPINILQVPEMNYSLGIIDINDWLKEGDPKKIMEWTRMIFGPDSTITSVRYRLWWKAECNQKKRGFNSACIGTFGGHKFWGNTMQWMVKPYLVCGPGKLFCIEREQPVGQINYHRGKNCGDSIPSVRPIFKFSCP